PEPAAPDAPMAPPAPPAALALSAAAGGSLEQPASKHVVARIGRRLERPERDAPRTTGSATPSPRGESRRCTSARLAFTRAARHQGPIRHLIVVHPQKHRVL